MAHRVLILALLLISACSNSVKDRISDASPQAEPETPVAAEQHAINRIQQPGVESAELRQHSVKADQTAPLSKLPSVNGGAVAESELSDLASVSRHLPRKAMREEQLLHFALPAPVSPPPLDREGYAARNENRFLSTALSPFSTFGLDVDSASYSNVRRQINQGRRPVPGSVRLEEMLNYFDYNFPVADDGHPLSLMSDYSVAPWNPAHRLAMIGVKAKDLIERSNQGARLTFLLDTSGSMNSPGKLPLLIRSFNILLDNLKPQDQVAIVTYAGSAGLVLPPTSVANKSAISQALNNLRAGGSTAGGAGIQLAYQVARQQFDAQASNMVLLATDGDFNVGVSDDASLKSMIEQQRKSGVFLSILGLGSGNYQDGKMQTLAEAGNGVAHYIDSDAEAQRLFSKELTRTLHVAARDVKLQIEFNPAAVAEYRLLGYESRVMAAEDFRDDQKDSGEVNAGYSVLALYEIVPSGSATAPDIEYRYQASQRQGSSAMELGYVKLRYKNLDNDAGIEIGHVMSTQARSIQQASVDLQWASAVAEISMILAESKHRQQASLADALARARSVLSMAPDDKKAEFVALAERVSQILPLALRD